MAYISYNTLWESEFDNIVSKRDKLQDLNINQSKLEVHNTYKKDKKTTTSIEPTDDSDVINKAHQDEKLLKINGHLSFLEDLQRVQFTIQQTIRRRYFNSKTHWNDDTNTLW